MGTVGTWVFPVMWTLFCMFCMAMSLEPESGEHGWQYLLAKERNKVRVIATACWSLIGWLLWISAVYWRTRGGC